MPQKKTKAAKFSTHTSPPKQKGRSLFFGIGINEYQHFDQLNNAVKDINDVLALLEERYEIDKKILLLNEEATKDNITNQLEDLVDLAQPEDKVIIYYSGHGVLRNETGYWVPVDGVPGKFGRFIRNQIIHGCIKDIQARHILLISDSCFSGSLVVNRDVAMPDANVALEELEKDRSRWVLSSGRQTELVADGPSGKNSPFATSILKVLRDNREPKLNVAVLADKVVKLTRYNWEQMPQGSPLYRAGHEGGQYVFSLAAGEPEAWATAEKENTTAAYLTFLQGYPDGPHARDAQKNLDRLAEKNAWAQAQHRNTPVAYHNYLAAYPNGTHASQALEAMRKQEEEAAWQKATAQNTLYSYNNYTWTYPGGKYQVEAEQRIQQLISHQEKTQDRPPKSQFRKAAPKQEEKPKIQPKKSEPKPKAQPEKPKPEPLPLHQQLWFRIAAGMVVVVFSVWVVLQFSGGEDSNVDPIPSEPTQINDSPKSEQPGNTVELAGKTYTTIQLNGQTWLAQNLNYDIGEGSWCYDDDPANCREFGRLYTWAMASAACRKLGPGWRLPSDDEWRSLAMKHGGYYDYETSKDMNDPKKSYKALLEGGSSGFAALLGGGRNPDGTFSNLGTNGGYWSGTEMGAQYAWYYHFLSYNGELYRFYYDKAYGFSCRCLQDN